MFMMLNHASCSLCVVLSLLTGIVAVQPLHNADHIFNAVHSSMRQWGSSLNHNGVSFFRAEVPRGTNLYHGTWKSDRVEGMEWLAFEPEHALNFAFKLCDTDTYIAVDAVDAVDAAHAVSPKWWHRQGLEVDSRISQPGQALLGTSIEPRPLPPRCIDPGWIHTYAPTRNLNLLYIDGTSAGSTSLGVQDSQDYVLLWNSSKEYDPRDPASEMTRARGLCELAKDNLEGKIDGFIRMEHGFEIILCDFALLEVVSILRSTRSTVNPGLTGRDEYDQFFFLRALTLQYHSIGGDRVCIDYDNFVTAFAYPEIDLWPEGNEQPRLNQISNATASAMVKEIKKLVLATNKSPTEQKPNWQSIADMYVDRYARPIQNMGSSNFDSAKAVHREIQRLFQPYLNRTHADTDATIKRCRQAYIPAHLLDNPHPSLVQQVIEQSMHHLCLSLHEVLMERNDLEVQKHLLHTLVDRHKWTAWKDCVPGCALNEICFTAIWPFGTREDHETPGCRNATGLLGRFGYWDGDGDGGWRS